MNLQGLIVQPRSPDNKRIAKTDNIKYSDSDDGFHYKMLDENDHGKFRIMNERQEYEELCKSREIKENMMSLTGKFKDGQYVKEDKSKEGIKFVPPQFGATTRGGKADKKAWESDMASSLHEGSMGSMKTKSAKYQNTILELARNSAANAEHKDVSDDDEPPAYRRQHPNQTEYDESINPNSQLFDVVNTMKNKYEQNLHVVEKLYNEKRAMENHIESLEYELRSSGGARRGHSYDREIEEDGYRRRPVEYVDEAHEISQFKQRMSDTYGDHGAPPYSAYDHLTGGGESKSAARHSDYEPSSSYSSHSRGGSQYSSQPQPRRDSRYSAENIADHFGSSRQPHNNTTAATSATSRDSFESLRQQRAQSAPRSGRSSGAPPRFVQSSADTNDLIRSTSTLRRSSLGISTTLQADADRYVQKRRMLEEKERLNKLEEKQYLQDQKERLLRASMSGRQFTEMFERQQKADEDLRAKQDLQKIRDREERQNLQAEKQKQAAQKQKLLDDAIKNAPSWQQIQSLDDERRHERVEKRKQELALLSASGPQSSLMNASTPRGNKQPTTPTQTFTIRARDPQEVAKALAEQKRARDQMLFEEERRHKERQLAVKAAAESTKAKTTMELRKEYYEQKYKKRLEEKHEKEAEIKRKQQLAEQKKFQYLLNKPVPIGKNTKSMELKAEKIKMDLERQKAEERRHAAMLKKKQLSEKETAAVVRSLVKEREAERRGSSVTYSEVNNNNNNEAAIAARAAAARREYKEKLKENQRKLEESLKSRPSLLERHDKKVVGKESAKDANKKFKDIVKGSGVNEKDEIFAKLGFDEYDDDFN